MRYILSLLLLCNVVNAQTFDFNCYMPDDAEWYSDITLDTPVWDYVELFFEDLYLTTGDDQRNKIDYEFTNTASFDWGTRRWNYRGYIILALRTDEFIAAASGHCDDDSIELIVGVNYWNNATILQRLWLIYHELGHDVLNLAHNNSGGTVRVPQDDGSTFNYPRDPQIMHSYAVNLLPTHPSSIDINYFIGAKEDMFNRINQIELNCN